jgi:deaminated glutathione amidase
MKSPVTLAAVQLSSQADVAENLDRVAVQVAEAGRRGAGIVLLPENFAFMGDEEGKRELAESLETPGPIGRRLAELALEHRVHLIGGGFPERSDDPARPFNSCVVISPEGRLTATYRKIHLFDVDVPNGARYRESASTTAGTEPRVCEIQGASVGLSVCYDLRFPELYRALSAAGAEILVVPAAFTLLTGKDHWHVLLRARAIEAQSYVVAAAQWGTHPKGRHTYGKSCIIDPWGDVIAQASEGEGVVVATAEPGVLARVRGSLPSLAHRRL